MPESADEASTTVTEADGSGETAAPVLPDPRPELGPAPEAAPTPVPVVAATPAVVEAAPTYPTPAATGGMARQVYSLQVASLSSQGAAESMARRVRSTVTDPVDVVQESDGNWRVYAGRADDRGPIDALKERLVSAGFDGCWTKQRTIGGAAPSASSAVQAAPSAPLTGVVFSVQVFAAAEEGNARRTADVVRGRTRMAVEVVQVGALWKVFVGRSQTREPIDVERDRLRLAGYPEAWTQQRSGG